MGIGPFCQFPLLEFIGVAGKVIPAWMQAPLAVEDGQIGRIQPGLEQKAGYGGVGSASTEEHGSDVPDLFVRQQQGIDQPRQSYAGGALGVIVPNRDLAGGAQFVQHPVAVGLGNVLQIHSPHAGFQHFHKLDQFSRIRFAVLITVVHAESDGIKASQILHQHGFAFHHAQAAKPAAITIAQHPGAITHHCHQIFPVAQFIGKIGIVPDGSGNGGHPWRVPHIEPIEAPDASLGQGLHLAPVVGVHQGRELFQEGGLRRSHTIGRKVCGKVFLQVGEIRFEFIHIRSCMMYSEVSGL